MKIIKRDLGRFLNLNIEDKFLILKIFFLLGLIRFCILYRCFEKNLKFFGERGKESTRENLEKEDYLYVRRVSSLVEIASKRTPWKSACLVKGLTLAYLLRKRNIKGTIYLGVSSKKGILAHAWVRTGTFIISGATVMKEFKQVACYSF